MLDFTNCVTKNKAYTGANGNKRCIVFNNEQYMLKFPPKPSRNKDMSYANSCISEYIGCHIYESLGIPVQKTLLGTYKMSNGTEKVVVACKDFTSPGVVLQDFASLKNTVIDSEHNGYGTELNDILDSIDNQTSIDSKILKEHFWNIFIVDALIGNWDRHNGNWGMLYNENTDKLSLAPIYDCGSSLLPQADENFINNILNSEKELAYRVYEIPLSCIKEDNKKINYFSFISSLKNEDCNNALKRIVPRIDMQKINNIIDGTPYITDTQKLFYKTFLEARKEHILDYSLELLKNKEHAEKENLFRGDDDDDLEL